MTASEPIPEHSGEYAGQDNLVLPDGRPISAASAKECRLAADLLSQIAREKERQLLSRANSRKVAAGKYEVTVNGKVIGAVQRNQMPRGTGWEAIAHDGQRFTSFRSVSRFDRDRGFETREEAGRRLIKEIRGTEDEEAAR